MADASNSEWFDHAGGEPVELSPADPEWPRVAAEWAKRISDALALPTASIVHVGSTAVPGLIAKPVIDLQVAVPDVADEAAYRPALEALGLVLRQREPDHRFFRPPAGELRTVHVHVCQSGSAWEREHLEFRDILRRDAEAASAYALLKAQLAARFSQDRAAYNSGKSDFIHALLNDHKVGNGGDTPV